MIPRRLAWRHDVGGTFREVVGMTRKGLLAAALILALSGASWKSATAAPITYTISFTASGTLDGRPFHNEPVQIVASSDTERVVATRKNKLLVATTATFGYRD